MEELSNILIEKQKELKISLMTNLDLIEDKVMKKNILDIFDKAQKNETSIDEILNKFKAWQQK